MKKVFIALTILLSCYVSANANYQITDTLDSSATYIDIRSINAKERLGADMKGAIWVDPHSLMDINDFLKSADKKKKYIIFCSCPHEEYSTALAEIMNREGFENIFILKDGWDVISNHHLTVRRSLL